MNWILLRKSKSPTAVLADDGEVHANGEAQIYVHDLNLFVTVQLLQETPAVPSLGTLCEDHGYFYERVSSQKSRLPKVEDYNMPHGQLRASCCSKVIHQFWSQFIVNIDIAGFVFTKSSPRAKWRTSPRRLVRITIKPPLSTPKKRGMAIEIRTTVCEIFLNDRSACTRTQFSDSERPSNVVSKSRKHSLKTHFPEDRNCQVCLQTKMTRPPCRRRTGKAPPRAEKFGDLITADHKVLNEEGESRNNLRHAVVVQDLATQWIQSYFTRDGEFTKVPRTVTIAKSYLDAQILEVWKILWRYIKESSNFNTSSVPDAEGAVRRVKGTSAVLLRSGLDEKW